MVSQMFESTKHTALDQALTARLEKLESKQDGVIRDLRSQVKALTKASRKGGGFPWGLVLLGGAVYLYRSNASVREQVDNLLDRVNPGIKGNLARAGDAAKQAVGSVLQGQNPSDAAQDAAGELKQAGAKGVEQAKDMAEAVKRGTDEGVKA